MQNFDFPLSTLSFKEFKELKTIWEKCNGNFRVQVLRAFLFHMVNRSFLGKILFGLPVPNENAASASAEVSCSDAELGFFERDMRKRNGNYPCILQLEAPVADMRIVSNALLSEWRRATLKCIEAAGHDEGPALVRRGADHIRASLQPLMVQDCSESELAKFHNDILQLCKKAYDFRMMMRKSQDHYQCYIAPGRIRSLGQLEQYADVVGVAGGGAQEMGDRVAFTLFGGLRKGLDNSERVYLEKAQIVMDAK